MRSGEVYLGRLVVHMLARRVRRKVGITSLRGTALQRQPATRGETAAPDDCGSQFSSGPAVAGGAGHQARGVEYAGPRCTSRINSAYSAIGEARGKIRCATCAPTGGRRPARRRPLLAKAAQPLQSWTDDGHGNRSLESSAIRQCAAPCSFLTLNVSAPTDTQKLID